ncbi:MAG: hypothetical protein ACOCWR_04385, partial [Oceanidesulfovibrio sp.]
MSELPQHESSPGVTQKPTSEASASRMDTAASSVSKKPLSEPASLAGGWSRSIFMPRSLASVVQRLKRRLPAGL